MWVIQKLNELFRQSIVARTSSQAICSGSSRPESVCPKIIMTYKGVPGRIKIAFVSHMLVKMGGSERNLHDLALAINRMTFEPYIFTFLKGEVAEAVASQGIPVYEMSVRHLLSMDALRKGIHFVRFLREHKIDIVVTYHPDADIFGGVLGRVARVPVIISNRRDTGFNHRREQILFYRIFRRLVTAYIAVSNAVRDIIIFRDGVPPQKVHVIHNGVRNEFLCDDCCSCQLGEITPEGISKNSLPIIIGVLGRLERVKGQKSLVKLAFNLKGRIPHFVFLCVGFIENVYYREMVAMIRGSRVGEHFEFVGHQNDISPFVRKMDFLIFPSRSEGFSNAVIEAMAMGKPVIATRVGGNPEAVVDGETGFLVSLDHPDELRIAAETLCLDEHLRQEMGRKARARVEQMFTVEKMVRAYEDIFQHYLTGCRRA